MIIDVHCHAGLSARRVDPGLPRFSFEKTGAVGSKGYDSYFSPRLLKRVAWFFLARWSNIDRRLQPGDELDAAIEANHAFHHANTTADRLVLLAFDEYHDNAGRPIGMVDNRRQLGSDLYVSNSFVRALCDARPDRYLFGGSIHPYRAGATDMLAELAAAGIALIKWLPYHQNIDAKDPRTISFLREAARLRIPVLIHYGGETSLSPQHEEFEHPGPLLATLCRLRGNDEMPTTIVAHVATPSFPWQNHSGHDALVDALLGEFADAPLYADISALAAFGRTSWCRKLASNAALHRKLVWGSDFPIPPIIRFFWMSLDHATRKRIAALPSWIEQDLQLKRALGFDECVFHQSARILNVGRTEQP